MYFISIVTKSPLLFSCFDLAQACTFFCYGSTYRQQQKQIEIHFLGHNRALLSELTLKSFKFLPAWRCSGRSLVPDFLSAKNLFIFMTFVCR